ncbi:MAG TPA: MFS transporter, partial [Burkholderiales bacterium]|nr:MFS transporter [Burkholderiales bacterium]
RLIAAVGEEALLSYSLYVAASAFVLMPLFRNIVMLGVVSFVVGLGMGCGQPITTMMIFAHSPGGRSGSTMGLRQTINNVMRMSGPAVFGLVASALGVLVVFWANAVLMSVGGWMARRAGAAKASERGNTRT